MVDKDMRIDPGKYAVDAALRDGTSIRIRAITTDDQDRLHEHFRGLSRQSTFIHTITFSTSDGSSM